jgi:3',5'-nucleoside bisphosphate phosphatase
MKLCDLHIHTAFSDGTDTPESVVGKAARAGLSAICITDHDSVSGVEAAISEGKRQGIEVLAGIELTAEQDGSELHMLGYLIDHRDPRLQGRLAGLQANRIERIFEMLKKLADLGISMSPEAVFALSGNGTVGRLHLARAMVNEGVVGSVYEAFNKYIGDRGPAYVAHFRLSPADAIALIRGYGGIPVLAHPYSLRKDELIPGLAEAGLRGLEVYYPEHSQSMINFYLGLTRRLNLLATGGSDYHGSAKPDVELGEIKVPYELVELLRQAAAHP